MRHVLVLAVLCSAALADPLRPEPPASGEPAGILAQPPASRPAPPPTPPVAPEIGKLGKQIAGTYKCKGVALRADGSSTPLTGTVTAKLDLDNAWIQTSLVEDNGIKMVEYRTYDGVAKQWTRLQMASTTAHVVSTSLGEQNGKWTWEGTATSPQGTTQLRDHEQRDGKQLELWGEALLGGSWQKQYQVTCKRS